MTVWVGVRTGSNGAFVISSSGVVEVSPFLGFDLLADVDQGGGLPSPSASTTETPPPADQ